jgi:hypothetical protein
MIYFDTRTRASTDAIRSFLALFGDVKVVGDDSIACDWAPVSPSIDDLADDEFRKELGRSLLTVRENQFWWRLNDAAFRTGDLLANIANALRVLQVSKQLVEAKLAESWLAAGTVETVRSCWDAAAFYPLALEQRTRCAERGFVVLSEVAISLDALKRFSIVGTVLPPSSDVVALAGTIERLLDGQGE